MDLFLPRRCGFCVAYKERRLVISWVIMGISMAISPISCSYGLCKNAHVARGPPV